MECLPNNDNKPDTIFALSSGALPSAIAIVRISGPEAGSTLNALAGGMPDPRRASLRRLSSINADTLDHALILWFPGPDTATGEDLAELHLHGSRAVIAAVYADLAERGLRLAEPGEFTRRALLNERLDLSAAEGLADLLAAETERQRREALRRTSGALARQFDSWTMILLGLAARLEAAIDYDGEEDVGSEGLSSLRKDMSTLGIEIDRLLAVPPVERLRDGLRIVISGPPNSGKSTLFNALLGRDAAIVSPIAGTTRDAIERIVSIRGMPFVLIDTAGIREADDPIERIGIERAEQERAAADIVLALGDVDPGSMPRADSIRVTSKIDLRPTEPGTIGVSATSGEGLGELLTAIADRGEKLLPAEGDVALDQRYRDALRTVSEAIIEAMASPDVVIMAEAIRTARLALDRVAGKAGIEDMLDALFGRFCLGK